MRWMQEKYLWAAAACWGATGCVAAWPQWGLAQGIAWASALVSVYFLTESNRYLSPGAQQRSRFLMALLLISTPALHRAVAEGAPQLSALALLLGAVRFGAEAGERRSEWPGIGAILLTLAGWFIWPPMAALVLPLLLWMMVQWLKARNALGAIKIGVLLAIALLLQYHSTGWWNAWEVHNWFRRSYPDAVYWAPNIVHAAALFAHPFLCLALPPLFFLFKKTDLHLDEKKALGLGLALELLLVAGFPRQSVLDLLPAWGVLLLLCFPAWDRFCSYGFYFFKKLITILLYLGLAIQWIATMYILWEKF